MAFGPDILKIDVERETERVVSFLREQVKTVYRRNGIVVGLSGGIDSAVVAGGGGGGFGGPAGGGGLRPGGGVCGRPGRWRPRRVAGWCARRRPRRQEGLVRRLRR